MGLSPEEITRHAERIRRDLQQAIDARGAYAAKEDNLIAEIEKWTAVPENVPDDTLVLLVSELGKPLQDRIRPGVEFWGSVRNFMDGLAENDIQRADSIYEVVNSDPHRIKLKNGEMMPHIEYFASAEDRHKGTVVFFPFFLDDDYRVGIPRALPHDISIVANVFPRGGLTEKFNAPALSIRAGSPVQPLDFSFEFKNELAQEIIVTVYRADKGPVAHTDFALHVAMPKEPDNECDFLPPNPP